MLSVVPISISRMSSLLVLVAVIAAIGAALVLSVGAVLAWLDLEQADFCVGPKGVSVRVRRASKQRSKKRGRGTR